MVGLITVQLLQANGCRVLGIDFDSKKCRLAREFGAETVDLSAGEDPIKAAEGFSRGRGVDAVIISASTKSSEPLSQAATMSRKRGRIVLVGVIGQEISRADFYEKELSFQVSCSYGPGRYDSNYEDKGNDYPVGFVRWTEQRNFEAILDLMSSGRIDVKPLISQRFAIDFAEEAYDMLNDHSSLGILLDYSDTSMESLRERTVTLNTKAINQSQKGNVAFIGGGNYASKTLIPAFKSAGANCVSIVTSGGVSSVHHGNKNGFLFASTDVEKALDDSIDVAVIATQHNLHAHQTTLALKKGKHVFVEKPLALNHDEVNIIEATQNLQRLFLWLVIIVVFSHTFRKSKISLN